jgi:hypothetical protein
MKKDANHPKPGAPSVSDRIKAVQEPSPEDYFQAAAAISNECKMLQAILSAPVYTLPEILPLLTIDKLRDIYRTYCLVPGPSRLKKQQIIDRLLKVLPDPVELFAFILIQPDIQWEFLRDMLEGKEIKDNPFILEFASLALSQGYVYLFRHDDAFIWIAPDEIKAAFKQIDNDNLRREMKIRAWMNDLACAVVNLYGILPLDDFSRLINDLTKADKPDELNADLLGYYLRGYDLFEYNYRFEEGYLTAIDFTDDEDDDIVDMDAVRGFVKMREDKPRYTPDIKTLMRYADPEYYEVTPQVKLLRKALRTMGLSADKAEEVTDALHEKIAAEEDFSVIMKALDECEVTLKADKAESIIQLIIDMHNNTRIWSNFGHTPRETINVRGIPSPRSVHLSANTVDLIKDDRLDIDKIKQGIRGTPFDNPEFEASLMAEIARAKAMKDDGEGGEIQVEGNVVPLRKVGRNDLCPCGSGLKYKKCCGKNE